MWRYLPIVTSSQNGPSQWIFMHFDIVVMVDHCCHEKEGRNVLQNSNMVTEYMTNIDDCIHLSVIDVSSILAVQWVGTNVGSYVDISITRIRTAALELPVIVSHFHPNVIVKEREVSNPLQTFSITMIYLLCPKWSHILKALSCLA